MAETTAPYASVVVANNGGENKLDYYLRRRLSYAAGGCSAPVRRSRVAIPASSSAPLSTLSNAAVPLSILGLLLVVDGGAAVMNSRRSRNRV